MKSESATRIKPVDLDRIQELPDRGGSNRIRWSAAVVLFGGLCFGLGLWVGRDTGIQREERNTLRIEALPMLFAARGTSPIRVPMFTVIPMPKPNRGPSVAIEMNRRPAVLVKVPDTPTKKIAQVAQKNTVKTTRSNTKKGNIFYSLQLRSYQDRAEALGFYRNLKAQGYGVWAENYVDQAGRKWVRIFVGRFKARQNAEAFRTKFKRMQGILGLVVQKTRPIPRFRWIKKQKEGHANTKH